MLTATHLQHSFGSGASRVAVLRNASLQLQGGELTLISGPSGCGKSTLLAILSGLLAPDRGTVSALGHDLRQMSVAERDRFRLLHTGFVFQTFNLFAGLSALEQVCLPLAYLGSDRSQATDKALQALRAVGLESRAHMRPAALSGGEQQRVAVARAIAKAPRFLFADEPTSALDSINGDTVTQRLREIAHDTGAVVLCVSHDPRMVARADRVLEMQDGGIESDSYRQLRAPHLARAIS